MALALLGIGIGKSSPGRLVPDHQASSAVELSVGLRPECPRRGESRVIPEGLFVFNTTLELSQAQCTSAQPLLNPELPASPSPSALLCISVCLFEYREDRAPPYPPPACPSPRLRSSIQARSVRLGDRFELRPEHINLSADTVTARGPRPVYLLEERVLLRVAVGQRSLESLHGASNSQGSLPGHFCAGRGFGLSPSIDAATWAGHHFHEVVVTDASANSTDEASNVAEAVYDGEFENDPVVNSQGKF
mmetsp:Transcript_13352/g.38821  ORF Transcript_13352/g.38821 Transcript_13352/m.38821 type:complete len:248 (+) Transcript_13352:160-903(+)